MYATAAKKYESKGRREGMREGMRQGVVEGKIDAVSRLLIKRFGDEAFARCEQHVRSASLAQLDGWIERIISADSVDDVFADSSWISRQAGPKKSTPKSKKCLEPT